MLTDDLADKLLPLKSRASSLLDSAAEKANSLDDYLLDRLNGSVGSRWDFWLSHHPTVAWLLGHPIVSLVGALVIIVLVVRLLATIYRAIANAIDRLWLWILQLPFKLLKLVFGWEVKPKEVPSANTTITNYEVTNNPQELQEIMARLDFLQQQQQQIIQDLAQLKQHSIQSQPFQLTSEKQN